MDNEQDLYEALQAKVARNKELTAEINQSDEILAEKKVEQELSARELKQLRQQFNAIRTSVPWQVLRRTKKSLKTLRAYGTGRRHVRQLLKTNKQNNARKQIKRLKFKIELGFTDKAVAELQYAFRTTDNPYVERDAAWELALWYANKYTKEGARQCLEYIDATFKKGNDPDFIRQATIIKAEAYSLLNENKKGMRIILEALERHPHVDLYLAAANMEPSKTKRIEWVNKALALFDMASIGLDSVKSTLAYNCLTTESSHENGVMRGECPKVTVIVPVYNSADTVGTALESILRQTWHNLEVLVVNDGSTDDSFHVINRFVQQDSRVKLLQSETNSGPYVARNIALKEATGEFVTVNDADDWSHAGKIEEQASHLMNHEQIIANTTQQARLTEDLTFFRRGMPGKFVFSNMSSLMFRRNQVMDVLGFWDSVRFGADSEFIRRLKKIYGEERIVDLQTGPFSFPRQSRNSLTGGKAFGYHGFLIGARKEYAESHRQFHEQATSLYYPFPMKERLFPVPEPMWPNRKTESSGYRHFDVVMASEFRLLGGTNMSNIEEIKAQKKMGLRTGLIQMNRYDFTSEKKINPKVRELIDGEDVQMLVYGEKITCDVLILRHPPILEEWQKYIPYIEARNVRVIVNQPPMREYSENARRLYDINRCAEHLKQYTGKMGKWYPIGPAIRETLLEHHRNDLKSIKLAADDWVNIINIEEWPRATRPQNEKIVIGRHSRDQYVKWPDSEEELLAIYPDSPDYEIHVLGGAKAPEKVLGTLPENWSVQPFGEMEPRAFLQELDVFVYYTHPNWVEAFGRVIFEAMAAGVPVVIPPSYETLFGEAAIYAEPDDVKHTIDHLMADDDLYQAQVEKAWTYVENRFGYTMHASRLMDCIVDDISI